MDQAAYEIVPCGAIWPRQTPELEADAGLTGIGSVCDIGGLHDMDGHRMRFELTVEERDLQLHQRAERRGIHGPDEETLEAHVRGLERHRALASVDDDGDANVDACFSSQILRGHPEQLSKFRAPATAQPSVFFR